MMMLVLVLAGMVLDVTSLSRPSPPAIKAERSTRPAAKCEFSVHKDGPNGDIVTGTALDVILFYKIRCEAEDGYCLSVANCTISSEEPGFKPYAIIDENGCSLESSLYDDVTYESSFVAFIRNPYPVRFRSSSGAVILYCVTTLVPTILEGVCERHECPKDSSS
ncbi:ZP domain-containing protein [Trichostrongylus colubriformis]|uniref:ZP domain-containing protein n=1 Tax=Trichostrongylus colubriformis TaxID=6319 RepID=A0AAN8FEL9_TRICO